MVAPVLFPIAPLMPPAVPHIFTRCTPLGVEPELDYLRVPTGCAVVRAFPLMEWVDVSAIFPGHMAAPALSLQYVLGAPMHLEWGTAVAAAELRQPELLTMISLNAMERFADAQEGLGVFDKVYTSTRSHFDVLEIALSRCPTPSPFLLGPGELVVPSAFLSAAVPPVLAVIGVAAVPAFPGQAAVAAVLARVAVAGAPGRPAVPAVRARGTRPGAPAVPAVPAVRAVTAHAGSAAIPFIAARPAIPAVLAVAGRAGVAAGAPAELGWLHLVRLGARVDETSVFPFLAFLRLGAAAPDRCSQMARGDPNSFIREVADSLRAGTLGHSSVTTLGDAALARHFPAFSLALDLLPAALKAHAFDPAALGRELVDAISFSGELAKQDAVTAARLTLIGRDFPSVHDFVQRAPGMAAKVAAIRALAPLGLGYRAGCSLFDCLDLLDAMLLKHSSLLTQSWNKGLSVVEVVNLLKIEEAEWKGAGGAAATVADGSLDATGRAAASLRGVTDAALRRAILEDVEFNAVAETIATLDLETNEGRASALETALLSGLSIFQRFFANPGCLTTKHAAFAALMLCLSELPGYLGRAQATDLTTGEVPELRDGWLFHTDQVDKLFKGRLSEIAWFNSPHGALGLMNLDASEPFLNCPVDQLGIVEAVLEETIPFVRATMIAAGWAAESRAGYTLAGVFERQLAHLRWIRKQGEMEVASLLPHAQACFTQALADCEASHLRMLSHPEPAVAKLDFHLAFGGPYDKALAEKTKGAAPIIFMRRAFPNLLPPSTPRSLAGVRLEAATAAAASATPAVGNQSGKGGKGGKGGGGKGKGEESTAQPGSLKGVVWWADATHMKLGTLVYDTTAIAKHYSLDADHCFPVLLSTKKGGAALALCPHWGEPGHTSLTSAKHVTPKDWNYTHVCSHMATKAEVNPKGAGDKRKRK